MHDAHALPSQQTVGVNKALSTSTRARGDEFETWHGVVRALETESTARRVVVGIVVVSTLTRVIALLPLLLLAPARRRRRRRLGHLSSRRHFPRAYERWRDAERTTTRRLDDSTTRWTETYASERVRASVVDRESRNECVHARMHENDALVFSFSRFLVFVFVFGRSSGRLDLVVWGRRSQ